MKKEVKYYLTQDEINCIEYIRTAKSDLEMMAEEILKENEIPLQYADFMYRVATTLSLALEKLKLE